MDNFLRKSRVQGRAVLASITDTVESFKTDWGETPGYYMVADQSPSSSRFAYWVTFLNQDTATLHGPEKYARIYNYPVYYMDVQKIKRGYYSVEFIPLCMDPVTSKNGEITTAFMRLLESKVRENPQYYLWSHRRWKHKRTN
jgi:KDO2-lipid IV(A) lauroyltransferase